LVIILTVINNFRLLYILNKLIYVFLIFIFSNIAELNICIGKIKY